MSCPLCKERDGKVNLLAQFNHWFLTFNRFPYLPGHLLLMPNKERKSLFECTTEEKQEFSEILAVCQHVLMKAIGCDSCNIGINTGIHSGASIPEHMHVHMVPRRGNDMNFIMVCAENSNEREHLQFFGHFGRIRNMVINVFVDNIDEQLSKLSCYVPNIRVSRGRSLL